MTIQYTLKMMAQIVHATLTVLYNGLALFGCGLAGLPLTIEDLTNHESK
jgi:hypothetical protein